MHYSDIKRKYTFNEEDDWGCYDEKGCYHRGSFSKKGYCMHSFNCKDGKQHSLFEHRIKWEYFNGNIPDNLEIDHIIPIKNGGTNKLSNLRLVTHQENMRNQLSIKNISKGLKGKYVGEKKWWLYGKQHSEETKKKMSEWRKMNQFGERNPMFGKHLTEEHKNAIKMKNQRAVKRVLENGEIIKYVSAYEAAKKTSLSQSSICYACRGCYGSTGHIYKNNEWYYV